MAVNGYAHVAIEAVSTKTDRHGAYKVKSNN